MRAEKETEGVTLVTTRLSAPQFPLHPYRKRKISSEEDCAVRASTREPLEGLSRSAQRG